MIHQNNKYKKYYKEMIISFKRDLNGGKYGCSDFYILNKDFLDFPEKRGRLNEKLLIQYKNKYIIEEDKRFVILDENTWSKIKSDYPNEKEIKVKGSFTQHKYIFEINNLIYYFYYINGSEIKEGYFRFQEHNFASRIIAMFYDLKIPEFFKKMKIKEINELQTINYENNIFYTKLKGKGNKSNNNIVNKTKKIIDNNQLNNFNNNNIHNKINNNITNNVNIDNHKKVQFNNYNNNNHNNGKNNNLLNNNIKFQNKNYHQNHQFNLINNNQLNQNNNQNNFQNNFQNNQIQQNINNKNNIFFPQNNFNQIQKLNGNKSSINIRRNEEELIIINSCTKGLVNVGATCYMNATLQCLAHVEKLTKYLLKPNRKQNILNNNNKYRLTSSFVKVLNNLWLNNNIEYYSPDDFKNTISEMNPLFAGIQANDSKDLILFLMETMHNELNKATKKNTSKQNQINQYDYEKMLKMFSHFFKNNYNSVISNLFYGMYNSMMKCLKCNKTTNNIQCFNLLIFPLEEVRKFKNKINEVNIYECFEYYQKEEIMMGANQMFCNHCNLMTNCINSNKLITGPNVLVIILNRGKGIQYNVKLNIDDYIDIKRFVNSKKSPDYYELIGVVVHFGPSGMSGHFIAFCKSFVDQKWYKYNDAQVNLSSFQELCTAGIPYILFYSYIKR